MPERVETTEPEGIDYGWVMQVTFVVSILVGAPMVAAYALTVEASTWNARLSVAARTGAVIWIVIACAVALYARHRRA